VVCLCEGRDEERRYSKHIAGVGSVDSRRWDVGSRERGLGGVSVRGVRMREKIR